MSCINCNRFVNGTFKKDSAEAIKEKRKVLYPEEKSLGGVLRRGYLMKIDSEVLKEKLNKSAQNVPS